MPRHAIIGLCGIGIAFIAILLGFVHQAHAVEPLRLQRGDVRTFALAPYVQAAERGGYVFSIQNSGRMPLTLHLLRQPFSVWARAVRDDADIMPLPALRLFSSDDEEFVAPPARPDFLTFTMPPNHVQTFLLLEADDIATIQVWSPDYLDIFENRLRTTRQVFVLSLSILLAMGVVIAVYRRSPRAFYASLMAAALLLLLITLWRDTITGSQLRLALGVAAVAIIVTQANLLARGILHRNYWTRIVILADICLIAACGLWAGADMALRLVGVSTHNIGTLMLAFACGILLLGAVFVPDRRHR